MTYNDEAFSQKSLFLLVCACLCLVGVAWLLVPHPVVPLALGLAPLGAMVAARIPFILGLLFILFSFFRLHEAFPFLMPFKFPFLLAAGTLFSVGINLIFQKIRPNWDSLFAPFICLFLLVTIGIFFSTNPGESAAFWKGTYIKIAIMVFALSWAIQTEAHLAWSARGIALSGTAIALVAITNKQKGIGLVEGTRVTIGRDIGSMLGDPNDLSLVMLFGAAFALAMMTGKGVRIPDRFIGVIGYLSIFGAIIATQSRGGLLGIIAVTGVIVSRKIKSKLLLGFLGLFALLILFALAGVDDRQSGGAHEEGIDESAMGRIYAWQAAFKMALYNPLTGVGVNNFLNNYFQYSPHWDGQNHAVHSTWFGVMAETGLLGLFVFLWMIIAIIVCLLKILKKLDQTDKNSGVKGYVTMALISGFSGFCVSGTFLTQGFIWPIYIILALTIALRRTVSKCNSEMS